MSTYMSGVARRPDLPVSEAERSARIQLAACYRIFDQFGWTELIFNHISLRVPGPERLFLINPFGLQRAAAAGLANDVLVGEEFGKHIASDRAQWAGVIKAANIKLEQ